jgi:hypothetical protein
MSLVNPRDEIRIKNETYFGQFDLVIAVLSRTKKQSVVWSSKRILQQFTDADRPIDGVC